MKYISAKTSSKDAKGAKYAAKEAKIFIKIALSTHTSAIFLTIFFFCVRY